MSETVKNLPASIHQRLKNEAEKADRPFQEYFYYYSIERFLARLSNSRRKDKFVLKGGLMFLGWGIPLRRPTRDIDVQGKYILTIIELVEILREICETQIESDGMYYDPESVRGEQILESGNYPGVRLYFMGYLGEARLQLHMDVSFANVITPSENEFEFTTLLNNPGFHLLGYPIETAIAEKVQAMVDLGMINERMKDFYDIWLLTESVDITGTTLVEAFLATFHARKTEIPENIPIALTDEFVQLKKVSWEAFLNRSQLLAEDLPTFRNVIDRLRLFLLPIFDAARRSNLFDVIWKAGESWQMDKSE